MSDIIKQTIIQTIAEMLRETQDIQWIKQEIADMFDISPDDPTLGRLFIQGTIKSAFSANLTGK
tara:strand:+ start:103 stop:294 length:192 start_codon:yes stop_codon:yes gene_type:complete